MSDIVNAGGGLYAVKWHLGGIGHVMLVEHDDADSAFDFCRAVLLEHGFRSAAIAGFPEIATDADMKAAAIDERDCSICRRKHGYEVSHASE